MEKLRAEWQLLLNSSFYTGEMGSKPLTGGVIRHFRSTPLKAQRNSHLVKFTCKDCLPPHQKICHCICSSQHWLQLSLAIHTEGQSLLFITSKGTHLCCPQFQKNRSDVLHCLAKLRRCHIPSQKQWVLKMNGSLNKTGISKDREQLPRLKKQVRVFICLCL